jgi:Zn-finger nucleic acid-binding protein
MRTGPSPASAVSTCYACWGLWIDTAELRKASGSHSARGRLVLAAEALDPQKAERALMLCPVCPDTQLLVQTHRGVEIDWCPDCRGIFLDKGEREQLVRSGTGASSKPAPRGVPFKPGVASGSGAAGLWLVGDLFEVITEIVSDL